MRLDVFGRFQVELVRTRDGWQVSRVGQGMRAPLDVTIPPDLDEERAIGYLEDLWHELAAAGQRILRVTR